MRVMSFNIRYNNPEDKENNWRFRKESVSEVIRDNRIDIAGLQEVLYDQLQDLEILLPEYGWVGIGRDNGNKAGEYAAIFYLKERFTILESSSFWLSDTPEIPSVGWDAACIRIVTWCKVKDEQTGNYFYIYNTHFDHEGKTARIESAKLILEKIRNIKHPVILTGDFNATPDSETYELLTSELLQDSMNISQKPYQGTKGTFQKFKPNLAEEAIKRIDYIFLNSKVNVFQHKTFTNTYNGKLPSDHYPVLAELK